MKCGTEDDWQSFAALGLAGLTRPALEGLRRFDHPQARLYEAVAHWIHGDDAAAIALLETSPLEHGRNLLALLRKPRIRVLGQLSWLRRGSQDLLSGIPHDERFEFRNISFHPHDLPNRARADVHAFYDPDCPPDFYVSQMVEWHLIPPDLQQLPCPLIGHTADFDLHIQAVHPWLQLFDEVVVADDTEWQSVSRLVRAPVSSFPKSFGIAERPAPPRRPREVDFLMTGTILHPFEPEKTRLYHLIQSAPDIDARFINGFLEKREYERLLTSTRATMSYVRHPGTMVTRGLEALSMGCCLVVQRGCVLTSYAGEEEGVLTYAADGSDLVPAIRRIVQEWPEFEARARRGAEVLRREFSLPRVASQYFRFLTFLAARPRATRTAVDAESLEQKRMIVVKGWSHGAEAARQVREIGLERWRGPRYDERPDGYIDRARELALEHAGKARSRSLAPGDGRLVEEALEIYRTGLQRFPHSLVLRFNAVRTALHFGSPEQVRWGVATGRETLAVDPATLRLEVMEDVFPWDYAAAFFNYRAYFDAVLSHLAGESDGRGRLRDLILASLRYYLAHYEEDADSLEVAVSLDPGFSHYQLGWARQLSRRGRPEDVRRARQILTALCLDSMLFVEAFETLAPLGAEPDVARRVARMQGSTIFIDDVGMRSLRPERVVPVAPRSGGRGRQWLSTSLRRPLARLRDLLKPLAIWVPIVVLGPRHGLAVVAAILRRIRPGSHLV